MSSTLTRVTSGLIYDSPLLGGFFVVFAKKESLGEYGSGWGWDNNTYAHSFDQTDIDGTPKQYFSDGTQEGICSNGVDITDGQILHSGNVYTHQASCKPNTGNAGNYYSFRGTTAEGKLSNGDEMNSACPKGWMLTTNAAGDRTSFYYVIRTIYKISESNNDSGIRLLPISFIRSGDYYQGSLGDRASFGVYRSSAAYSDIRAYSLFFHSSYLNPQDYNFFKDYGFSVRCVSR